MALTVREYVAADGKNPFREWLDSLTVAVRARIQAASTAVRDRQPRRPQERRDRRLGSSRDVRAWVPDLLRLDHRACGRRRQGIAGEGHFARVGIVARLSGGKAAWQDEVEIGMLASRRIFGIRSSHGSSCWRRSTRECRSKSRLAKSSERSV